MLMIANAVKFCILTIAYCSISTPQEWLENQFRTVRVSFLFFKALSHNGFNP